MFDDQKTPTLIGNDVWIGAGAFVRQGVTIGDGAIVAAGSVVIRDVLPYAIVGGIPAHLIRYRAEQETIRKLLAWRWWDLPIPELTKLRDLFGSPQWEVQISQPEPGSREVSSSRST